MTLTACHLAETNENINLGVRTRVTPSFKVRVCFKKGFNSSLIYS